jgi:hypothetical protein
MNISLPENAIISIGGQVTDGLSSFSSITTLLIGIFLAFIVIEKIINTLKKEK